MKVTQQLGENASPDLIEVDSRVNCKQNKTEIPFLTSNVLFPSAVCGGFVSLFHPTSSAVTDQLIP